MTVRGRSRVPYLSPEQEQQLKTKAAVMTGINKPFEIMELDLAGPKPGEVQVKFASTGLCHSELHIVNGDLLLPLPMVGGHEASAVVEEVGVGVTSVQPGDHVVCTPFPSDGTCRYCATGHESMCVLGDNGLSGLLPDGTSPFSSDGKPVRDFFMIGAFAERSTVIQESLIKIDPDISLEMAALTACGVPTGWGSATYVADVQPGEIVVVYGAGGIGMNAIQGAAMAGAGEVIVVDPVDFKRDTAMLFGATHTFASAAEAAAKVSELTAGSMADKALITASTVNNQVVSDALAVLGKLGILVVVSVAKGDFQVKADSDVLLENDKVIRGSNYGGVNQRYDIPRLLDLHTKGRLKLDGLVTKTYTLEQINDGYQDLLDGTIIRGMIVHGN
jgi:alcohol dehydrogenase (nicotinoprotein)